MKLVHPPVGFMFLEGAPRLAQAGLRIPLLRELRSDRIALEAYPGLLVRTQLGIREPYKSDDPRKQTSDRRRTRVRVLESLLRGRPLGTAIRVSASVRRDIVEDGTGDSLDAVICASQAAWAEQRRRSNFGLPREADPLEGWIITAGRRT